MTDDLSDSAIENNLNESFYPLFYLTQALIQQKVKNDIQLLCVNNNSMFTEALAGFAKTIHLEQPKIVCRVIEITAIEQILHEINMQDIEVRYDHKNARWVKQYEENTPEQLTKTPLLKKQGVYLITGGAGGLGLIFAHHLAANYQAALVLTGRSALNDDQKSRIAELEAFGSKVMYIKADVTREEDLQHVMQEIKERFGSVNGIIHAAGVLRDAFILKKTQRQVSDVLAPKIYGTIHLDSITKSEPLDFFIMFSSVVSIFGNIGQCDYAYANGFMDSFAKYRETLSNHKQRHGKTLVINWPLWQQGGMNIDKKSQQWMAQTLGLSTITNVEGIEAFINSLNQTDTQELVLPGDKKKLNQVLQHERIKVVATVPNKHEIKSTAEPYDKAALHDKTQQYLKEMISEITQLSPEKILPNETFENYGIDSLMIVGLNRVFEQAFGELPKTLFFEYLTLDALTEYFVDNHTQNLLTKLFLPSEPVDKWKKG